MNRNSVLFLLLVLMVLGISGCYIYSKEPPPPPAVIISPDGPPPAPSSPPPPPSGAVGPARY